MSVSTLSMADRGREKLERTSENLFRLVQHSTWSRCNLTAIARWLLKMIKNIKTIHIVTFLAVANICQWIAILLNVHLANPYLDRGFLSTTGLNVLLIVIVISYHFIKQIKRAVYRIIALIPEAIIVLFFLAYMFNTCLIISESGDDHRHRMNLFSDQGWTYYAYSPTRSPNTGLYVSYYKEKQILYGFLIQERVNFSEIGNRGFSQEEVEMKLNKHIISTFEND